MWTVRVKGKKGNLQASLLTEDAAQASSGGHNFESTTHLFETCDGFVGWNFGERPGGGKG